MSIVLKGIKISYRSLSNKCSFIMFLVSLLLNTFDNYNLAVTCLFISFFVFYYVIRKDNDWHDNPLKITVLVFMILHLMFWLRCLIVVKYPTVVNYDFYSYLIQVEDVPQAIYKYLMMTYLYFYSVYLGYRISNVNNRIRKETYRLNPKYVIVLGIVITSVAGYYYLSANLGLKIPTVIQYIGSNMERFFYLFWCLFAIILLSSQRKYYKFLAFFGFFISTIMGIVVLIQIRMRFILLMQIICAFMVYLHIRKVNFKTMTKLCTILIAVILMFGFISDIKFDRTSGTNQISLGIITSFDEMIARSSNAQVETFCVSSPEKYGYFIASKKSLIIYEILGGLPFANVFFSSLNDEASLDMQVNWVHAGQRVQSSFNVPLFTSLEYGFSLPIAIIVALFGGILHGFVIKKTVHLPFQYSWVISTSIFVRIAFGGVRREDLFGILVDIIMYIIIMRIVSVRVKHTGNSVI